MLSLPPFPDLVPLCRITFEVEAPLSVGPAPCGERRYVRIVGGTVEGAELSGTVVPGGADWQVVRSDGVLEIAAHHLVRLNDGTLIEVTSNGLRHGPAEVMARLARGEPVAPHEYFFRTLMRFNTGTPDWAHLNNVMAITVGHREAQCVVQNVYKLT